MTVEKINSTLHCAPNLQNKLARSKDSSNYYKFLHYLKHESDKTVKMKDCSH